MKKLLTISIACYIAIFSTISLWKYGQLRYNARDLAIYNQVVWQLSESVNSDQGSTLADRFYSSIQGHNYLGDHFEPILLLLVPFYALVPDPRSLLMLQTLALALAAWPLYLIAEKILLNVIQEETKGLRTHKFIRWTPLLVAVLWLLHPAVQNANLYEFHSVALAPLAFFSLFYWHLKYKEQKTKKNYCILILFLLLALFIREDVALITLVLGLVLGIQEWKKRKFTLLPIIMIMTSATWFLMAQRIIAHFSPSHGYQYRIYYQWLAQYDSIMETMREVFLHLLTLQNLEMLIGLLLPLLFLPLIKPKWLILTLLPLAAIVLSQSGGGALIWQMHYGLLLLPGIFIAFVSTATQQPDIMRKYSLNRDTVAIAIVTASLASAWAFGPIPAAVQAMTEKPHFASNAATAVHKDIPVNASVLATDTFLAPLSSRQDIALMPLSLLGVQQYGVASYPSSIPPEYIIFNEDDLWADLIQARTLAWSAPFAGEMRARFRQLLNTGGYTIIAQTEGTTLMKQTRSKTIIPPFDFETRETNARTGGFVLDRLGSVMFVEDTIH